MRLLVVLLALVAGLALYLTLTVQLATDRGPLLDPEERPMTPLTAPGVSAVPYEPEEATDE